MPKYGFSDPHFPCKDRLFHSHLIRENTGQRKLVFWYVYTVFSAARENVFGGRKLSSSIGDPYYGEMLKT